MIATLTNLCKFGAGGKFEIIYIRWLYYSSQWRRERIHHVPPELPQIGRIGPF